MRITQFLFIAAFLVVPETASAWISNIGFWQKLKMNLVLLAGTIGGSGNADGVGSSARFNMPSGVLVDGSGNILVGDLNNSAIRQITPGGVVSTLFAGVHSPGGIAFDSAGNLIVADNSGNRILKVTSSGVVSVVAGSGSVGSADGTGAAATFYGPLGILVDTSTNTIYVTDSLNNTIRKITSAGVVTTLAGSTSSRGAADGTGAAASFNFPAGMVFDSSGNLVVVNSLSHNIRKVTPAGVVSTFAGSAGTSGSTNGTGTSAKFNSPWGITKDSLGNFYVVDTYNYTIRKMTSAAVVTTLAGSAGVEGTADGTGTAARFNEAEMIGVDSANNLYVSDTYNSTIRKIVSTSGVVTTLAGAPETVGATNGTGAAAQFFSPAGLAVDTSGTVYVADVWNSTIRKITSAGVVTTLAGSAGNTGTTNGTGTAAKFYYPNGVATNSSAIYVADSGNNTIRKITTAGAVTTFAGSTSTSGSSNGTGTAATFSNPMGVAVDSTGHVYVADSDNNLIRVISSAQVVTTLAGSAGIAGSADGTGTSAQFNNPTGVAVDNAGNVFVADTSNYTIRKITAAGVVTTLAGQAGMAGTTDGNLSVALFSDPVSIAIDSLGNIYVTEGSTSVVRKISTTGLVSTVLGRVNQSGVSYGALPGLINSPQGIAVNNTSLFVTSEDAILKAAKP